MARSPQKTFKIVLHLAPLLEVSEEKFPNPLIRQEKILDKSRQLEKFQDFLQVAGFVHPSNTEGGHLIRKSLGSQRLSLSLPALKKQISFSVLNPKDELSDLLAYYNLACSRKTCALAHSLIRNDVGIFLEISIITSDSLDIKLFESLNSKLS